MAARFWVGGAGTWDGSATTHWAASSGGASGASAPTSADSATFDASSGLNAGGTVTVAATAACGGCTISGITSALVFFALSGNPTWSAGTYSFQGSSQARSILFQSNVLGTQRTLTINGTYGTHTDVHFQDIAVAGSAGTLTGTRIGDALGNSGVTFTVSATQTWSGTSGGNWSANAWTSRVPLPQDDVVIASAFSATQTVTIDVPRLGRSINWTGATGAPKWGFTNGLTAWIFGSLTLPTGMTTTSNNTTLSLGARSAQTITSNGVALTCPINIAAVGGTYTAQDALTIGNSSVFGLVAGTFTDNGKAISVGIFQSSSAAPKVLNMTGTWSVIRTGSVTLWTAAGSNLTINAVGSIIDFPQTDSAVTRTFAGAGFSYGTFRMRGTGSGALIITGNNTFVNLDLECTTAKTITLPAGSRTTVTGLLTLQGASGQLLSLVSSAPGTRLFIVSDGTRSLSFDSPSADVLITASVTSSGAAPVEALGGKRMPRSVSVPSDELPNGLLSTTQGCVVVCVQVNFNSTDPITPNPASAYVAWSIDDLTSNNRIQVQWAPSLIWRPARSASGSPDLTPEVADVFSVGDKRVIGTAWDAVNNYLSIGGAAFASAVATKFPTGMTHLHVGTGYVNASNVSVAAPFNGTILWAAFFPTKISDADIAALNASFLNSYPGWENLPGSPTALYRADWGYYVTAAGATGYLDAEETAGVLGQSLGPAEATSGLTAALTEPLEALRSGIAATVGDPLEALLRVAGSEGLDLEALAAILLAAELPIEALPPGVARTFLLPLEATRGIDALESAELEAVGAVLHALLFPFEARAVLRRGKVVSTVARRAAVEGQTARTSSIVHGMEGS